MSEILNIFYFYYTLYYTFKKLLSIKDFVKKYIGLLLLCISPCLNTMEEPSAYCEDLFYSWCGASKTAPSNPDQSYIELKNSTRESFYVRITIGGEFKYKEETGRWSRTQPGEVQFKDILNIGAAVEILRRKYQPLTLRFAEDFEFKKPYRAQLLTSDQLAGLRKLTALLDTENCLVLGYTYDFKGACCSICLNHVQENDSVQVLSCGHFFHIDCVEEWLATNFICPQCSKIPEITKIYRAVDYCEV